ncbi:MAG: hypothetical protein R3C61_22355, partial [Bacteroidia bacterium]
NGRENITLWRGTFYFAGRHDLFEKHMRLYYDAYLQPGIGHRENFRAQADIGIDFPVWKGVAFTTLYTFSHEHVVAQSIIQEDKILSFGITCNLKKR